MELLATLRRLPRLKRLELAENPVRLRPEDLGPLDAFDGRELRPATAPKPPLPRRKEKGYPGEVGGPRGVVSEPSAEAVWH